MRLAYADPPYPGMAHLYRDHPDYDGEVDHAELVAKLEAYDGWALSTAASTLQTVLSVCPNGVRIGAWHITNTSYPTFAKWWWSWEAVIFKPARTPEIATRDVLIAHTERGFLSGNVRLKGQKPPAFSRWVFGLLGARQGDTLDDLFPGSGGVSAAWESWRSQLTISPSEEASHTHGPFAGPYSDCPACTQEAIA